MSATKYSFAENFTRYPGGRYRKDGAHSGEEFFEDVLIPFYEAGEKVVLDLTDVMGFATSFLDGSFGEFAAKYGKKAFETRFSIEVTDDPTLVQEIFRCLDNAEADRKAGDSTHA